MPGRKIVKFGWGENKLLTVIFSAVRLDIHDILEQFLQINVLRKLYSKKITENLYISD